VKNTSYKDHQYANPTKDVLKYRICKFKKSDVRNFIIAEYSFAKSWEKSKSEISLDFVLLRLYIDRAFVRLVALNSFLVFSIVVYSNAAKILSVELLLFAEFNIVISESYIICLHLTNWGLVVYLYPFLTSALDGGEWLASRSGRFMHFLL